MPTKLNKQQLDILLADASSAPPSHRDQVLDYAIKYLNILSGPLTESDCKEATLIGRQKILFDRGIPQSFWNLQDDLYRQLRMERNPTHEKLEIPSYREPQTDGGGSPIIEHEATEPRSGTATMSAEPAPQSGSCRSTETTTPPDPAPESADRDAEVSRAFHIGNFLQHIARYGHG